MRVTRPTASTEYQPDRAAVRRGATRRPLNAKRQSQVPPRYARSKRELVPLDTAPTERTFPEEETLGRIASYRSNAPFIAHLIAVRDKDPQTREKRRADPETTATTYKATFKSTRRFGCGRILTHMA